MDIGKRYKIVIEGEGEVLTFNATIISIDDSFITFRDKFDKVLSYNKSRIIYFEEVKG